MFIRAELFESDEIVVVRCQNIAVAGVRDWVAEDRKDVGWRQMQESLRSQQ